MFQTCCFFLSLRTGCILVAIYFLLVQVFYIYTYSSLLPYLGEDEREDKENKQQRERVKSKTIAWLVVSSLFCVVAVGIILAVVWVRPRMPQKSPRMLKVLAVLIILPTVIAVIRTLAEKKSAPLFITLVYEMVVLVIALFCAAVLWSYAEELINPPDTSLTICVAPAYQYQHPLDPQGVGAPYQHVYAPQPYGPQYYQQPPTYQHWWAPQQFYAPPQTQPYYPQPGSPQPQPQPQPPQQRQPPNQ